VGGQPGEHPTAVIPSIFYDTDRTVSDPKKGIFDRMQAEALINHAEELSEKTGNPFLVDIMGLSAEAMMRYIDFISEITPAPFFVDSVSKEVKIAAIRHIHEVGLIEKTAYNSINLWTTTDELTLLRDLGVKSAVVLAYDPKAADEGRISSLAGDAKKQGLLQVAKQAGIQNILVDTAVLKVPSIGAAADAICQIKDLYGLPSGCSPNNAISIWNRIKTDEFGPEARKVCLGASTLFTQVMGADFIIAGPIVCADIVFPVVALADAINAAQAQKQGIRVPLNHPLYKIF
jgi:tetrahydromethanopterin S-methyltransferase subunit H